MDFHGMKRKDLQTLCKKHGIPANLKNTEMASRLASVFQKETEEIVTETQISAENSVEADGVKDNVVVGREAKKVRFSPENEVFEFTRSVKNRHRKNVRTRTQGTAQALQQGGVELRRSKRILAKGITVAGSIKNESNTRRKIVETEKECSLSDATEGHVVPRRSKRIGSSGSTQDDEKGSLEKKIPAETLSENNTENSMVGCISVGHCVNLETQDEVKDDNLDKSEPTISSERGCKLNALELSEWSSTDFASLSHKEENVSESFEKDEMKALSQPIVSHAVVFTTPKQVLLLGDAGIDEAGKEEEHTATGVPDEPDVLNTTERYLVLGGSRETVARDEGESTVVELPDESDINTCPVRQFIAGDNSLLLETDEGVKGDNTNAKSHLVSDFFTAAERQSLMGDSEPDEAEKIYRENKDVELLGESNISTNLERRLLSGDPGLDVTRKIKDNTSVPCEEPSVFTSPERRKEVEFKDEYAFSEPHNDGKQERKEMEFKDESAFFTRLESRLLLGESGLDHLCNGKSGSSQYQTSPKFILKDDSLVWECHDAARSFRKNTIADSSGSIASKISDNHEFNAGEETAGTEFIPKGSQAENVVGLNAIQGKQSRGNSPNGNSLNLVDFDVEWAETIMEAKRKFSHCSDVLVLPAEGNSETIGVISSHSEVAGSCSMVSDNDEAGELTDAKVTTNTQIGYEGNLILNSSGGSSYVSGKTCVLAESVEEHLGLNSEVDLRNTCEKSGLKFLQNEATGPIATPFEKAISLTPDECTVQDNENEKAADAEMIRRETTPSPEEILNESSENREECSNTDDSGTLSEAQVRREPIMHHRTQVKPKTHGMKENAPNSKIVHNLNLTAPRTSKRQPLQDLRKD